MTTLPAPYFAITLLTKFKPISRFPSRNKFPQKMMRHHVGMVTCCAFMLLLLSSTISAGWWDDLKQAMGEKLDEGADFAQNVAAPAIKGTWENTKTAVAESDAHAWVKDSALPAIKTGIDDVRKFIHEKTAADSSVGEGEETEVE